MRSAENIAALRDGVAKDFLMALFGAFCIETVLEQLELDINFSKEIFFCDKALFLSSGYVATFEVMKILHDTQNT